MNLTNLEASIYEQLGFLASPDTAITTRIRRHINQAQREALGLKGIGSKLRKSLLTFSTVANSPFAVLPQAAVNIFTITDRTNDNPLEQWPLERMRYNDPGLHASGTNPYAYAILGYAEQTALDPSDASELFVKSSSATDGATKTAYLEGILSGGYVRTASVALNGITAASFGATITTWIAVRKFYIALTAGGATTAAGTVTLNEDSGLGTELSRIGIGQAYPRYTRLHLYPTPSSVLTLYADVELHVEDMAQATDESILPEDFHWLLESGALKREFKSRTQTNLYALEDARWRKGIADMRVFLNRQTGVTFSDRRPRRFSQLGPYYPVGS